MDSISCLDSSSSESNKMLSSVVAVLFLLVASFSLQVPAASIQYKDKMSGEGAITEKEISLNSAKSDGLIDHKSSPTSIRGKRSVASGTIENTFIKLCLKAIDRYNRENGVSTMYTDDFERFVSDREEDAKRRRTRWNGIVGNWQFVGDWAMKTYPRYVKRLTNETENVYKNGKSQAKIMAATAMKRVQEVVDSRDRSRSSHQMYDRDAGHTATLNMWTEIYKRWKQTYPDIFDIASASVKHPTLVSNAATGTSKVEQNGPKSSTIPREKSPSQSGVFQGYDSLIQTQTKTTSTPLMTTVTDKLSAVSTQTETRTSQRNSIKNGRATSQTKTPINTRTVAESEDFPSLDSLRITQPTTETRTFRRNSIKDGQATSQTKTPINTRTVSESKDFPSLDSLRNTQPTTGASGVSSKTSRRNSVTGTAGSIKTGQPLKANKAEVSTGPATEEYPTLDSSRVTEQRNAKTKYYGSRGRSSSSSTTTKPSGSKFRRQRHGGTA